MRRLTRSRVPLPIWGLLGISAIVLVGLVAVFGTGPLGGSGFRLQAVFRSDAQIGFGSPVRIAGINVGTVTGVRPLGHSADGAIVSMSIDPSGLPIHADATLKIRTRLLLEGNFFVELDPGSPSAPALRSGATVPVTHTSGPVQLDRVLTSLPTDTRARLQTVLKGFGAAFGAPPAATPHTVIVTQNGAVVVKSGAGSAATSGLTGGQAINAALADAPAALRGTAQVTEALAGEQPHDLSRLVEGSSQTLHGLATPGAQLPSLVTNLDRTLSAFATHQSDVSRSVATLPGVLSGANAAFSSLDRSLPPTSAFSREVLPGFRALPSTIAAALPWMDQSNRLLGPAELGGLLTDLSPTVRDTAALLRGFPPTLSQLSAVDRCLVGNLLPVSKTQVNDPPFPAGGPVYREFFQTVVGVDGAAANFDGNGHFVRGFGGGGAYPQSTSDVPQQGPFRSDAIAPALGTRPAWPGIEPPFRTDVSCASSRPADLNAVVTGGTP